MDKNTLSSRLSRIEEELPKLSNTISAMKITDTGAYGKNYEELSLDAAPVSYTHLDVYKRQLFN